MKYLNIETTKPYKIEKQGSHYNVYYKKPKNSRCCSWAYTLCPSDLGTDENGWTVTGEVYEDYYKWVNYFEAKKNKQWVKGDFEDCIECSSLKAFDDFLQLHKPDEWDYWDI